MGLRPGSPRGRGKLTRPWGTQTRRTETDLVAQDNYRQAVDSDHAVVDVVQEIARERDVPMAHVALAWVRQQPAVTAPIVAATAESNLRDPVPAAAPVRPQERRFGKECVS